MNAGGVHSHSVRQILSGAVGRPAGIVATVLADREEPPWWCAEKRLRLSLAWSLNSGGKGS